ncbi:hypothetical protein ES288_A07G131300v1, partial [Gossypium darwinii]
LKRRRKRRRRRRDCKIPLKVSNDPNTTDPKNKLAALTTSVPATTTCTAIKMIFFLFCRFHVGCQHGKLTGHLSFLLRL